MTVDVKAYSIEPLSADQLLLAGEPGAVENLPRDGFSKLTDVHPKVSALICRDRDDILGILSLCQNLRFLFIVSAGVEKLPFSALAQRGITVCNAGGVNAEAMSQYAMAQILAHGAKVRDNLLSQQRHHWIRYQCTEDLRGKLLLIAGAGRSGTKLAEKAKVFGMRVIGAREPVEPVEPFDEIVSLDALDRLLGVADYVVCALPLTPKTERHFNASRFKRMKKGGLFVNMSRGRLVDIPGLLESLAAGCPSAAVLDVFDVEPVPAESDLWDVPNLYLTPHMAGRTSCFMDEAMRVFRQNFEAFRDGKDLPNKVNLENGY